MAEGQGEEEAPPELDAAAAEEVAEEGAAPVSTPSSVTPADATRIAMPGAEPLPVSANPTAPDATRISSKPPDPPANLVVAPGVLINDNYRILRMISAGGMGEVYRAENIFTGDPVAVKIILPNLARDETIIDLFRSEARILVQMRDDAIVRYHNFVRDRGLNRYCLIMEFVEGGHLWDYVKERGSLDVDQALVLMRRLAGGLAAAHARGVTHRDLSPDNVILRDNRIDEAVLIDFGIARSTELGDGLGGRFAGKFKYISPEQLGHGRGVIGPAADVYGLALMITAALRGSALDMGNSVVEASEARRRIPDLSGVSHRIYPLLQHMLEPDPAHRPADMQALLTIMDDPTHLPARYRLPLWQSQPGEGGEESDLIAGSLSASGATGMTGTESSSPFGEYLGLGETSVEAVADAPAPKSRRALLIAGVAALALAGAAGLWALTRPAPEPVTPPEAPSQTASGPPLPARDLESRDGFLAAEPLPACTFAARLAYGPNAGKIGLLADGARDVTALRAAYAQKFGSDPAVVSGQVTEAQCAALDFLRELSGRAAMPPVLSLDSSSVTSGTEVSGRLRELGGRSLWLFLVSPKGGVYDLSRVAVAQADGSFGFSFGISLAADAASAEPQLLLAVASEKPLASVAAAPAGSAAANLLPFALDEIRKNGGSAAVAVAPFDLTPAVPAPNTPAPAPEEAAPVPEIQPE